MSLAKTFLKNVSISYLTQILSVITSVLTVPYLIYTLGLAQYGLMIVLTTFIGFVSILGNGVVSALIKYLAQAQARDNKQEVGILLFNGLILNFFLGVTAALLLFVFGTIFFTISTPLSPTLQQNLPQLLLFGGFYVFFFFLGNTFWAFPQALQKFEFANLKDIILGLLTSILSIMVVFWGGNIVALSILNSILALTFFVLFILITLFIFKIKLIPKLHLNILKTILTFSLAKFVSDVGSQVIFQSDKILLSFFYPLSQLPYYSVPLSLVQRLTFFIMNIIPSVFALFSHVDAKGTRNDLNLIFVRVSKAINIIALSVYLFVFFYANPILTVWLGPEFAKNSTQLLRLLSLAYMIYSFSTVPSSLFESQAKPHIPAAFSTITACIQLFLFAILIPTLNQLGAALALVITACIVVPLFIRFTLKPMTALYRHGKQLYVIPILIGIIVFSPGLIFTPQTISKLTLVIELLTIYLLTAGFYAGLLFITGVFEAQEKDYIISFLTTHKKPKIS